LADRTASVVIRGHIFVCYADISVGLAAGTDELLPLAIPTIERLGGGSVRCMLAEVFSPA